MSMRIVHRPIVGFFHPHWVYWDKAYNLRETIMPADYHKYYYQMRQDVIDWINAHCFPGSVEYKVTSAAERITTAVRGEVQTFFSPPPPIKFSRKQYPLLLKLSMVV